MFSPKDTGWIEVICGSMFSGKTQELIRRIRLAQIAKQNIQAFKPYIDDRYDKEHIVSHDQLKFPTETVFIAKEIQTKIQQDTHVVAIDEAQFFSTEIISVCELLANGGKRVIVAGLDQDYRGMPFGPMPYLLSVAEFVTKNLAICVRCGNPANRTQRTTNSIEQIDVGASDKYEARCRKCFVRN